MDVVPTMDQLIAGSVWLAGTWLFAGLCVLVDIKTGWFRRLTRRQRKAIAKEWARRIRVSNGKKLLKREKWW